MDFRTNEPVRKLSLTDRWLPLKLIAGFGVSAAIIVAAIAIALYFFVPHTPAIFVNAQKKVSFPVYYPANVPGDLKLDDRSFSSAANVVLYSYTYDGGKKRLSVSVQPRDASLDTSLFKPTSEFSATIGRAYVVDLEDRTAAAVVGDGSWVLINAPDKIANDTLTAFINSLRAVN